jgi:hypothetical protein
MRHDDAIRIRHMIEAAPKRAGALWPDADIRGRLQLELGNRRLDGGAGGSTCRLLAEYFQCFYLAYPVA